MFTGSRGVTREAFIDLPGGTPASGLPSVHDVADRGGLVVAVVVGQTGTVASDVLARYEVFASSSSFSVYTVAEHASPAPLTGGTSLVPAHTFAEVDAGRAPAPDRVVVPAVSDPSAAIVAPTAARPHRMSSVRARGCVELGAEWRGERVDDMGHPSLVA